MALVTTKEMFKKAFEGKYAIGAFNINNMEIVQGVVEVLLLRILLLYYSAQSLH